MMRGREKERLTMAIGFLDESTSNFRPLLETHDLRFIQMVLHRLLNALPPDGQGAREEGNEDGED